MKSRRVRFFRIKSKLHCRTPLQATGYVRATTLVVMAIKNRVFSFADMLLFRPCFPDFQHASKCIGSYPITHSSNVTSITPQFTTLKLFFDFRVLFKDLSCCNTFYNLHDFWRRILWFSSNYHKYLYCLHLLIIITWKSNNISLVE